MRGSTVSSVFDPLVEATINRIKNSVVDLDPNINFSQIRRYISMIIQNPNKFNALSQDINAIVKCESAMEFLNDVLATEKRAAPPPPDEEEPKESSRRKTRSWTTNEDYRLIMGVHLCGENWNDVAEFVGGGRTRSQCSQRWYRVIDPRITKEHWTPEEEKKLLDLVQKYGEKAWIKVAAEMIGRSDVQCRYKYRKMQKTQDGTNTNSDNDSKPQQTQQAQPVTQIAPVVPLIHQPIFSAAENLLFQPTAPSPQPTAAAQYFEVPLSLDGEKTLFTSSSIFNSSLFN